MKNKCNSILNKKTHHKNIMILLKNILHTTNKNLLKNIWNIHKNNKITVKIEKTYLKKHYQNNNNKV